MDTYSQRDIRNLTQVANFTTFYKLLTSVVARTARPVVYDEIADDYGISAPTTKQ
ncbi:MAG: hypothetical protein WCR02_08935 [Sphaerochaetaceae bacterium]